MSSPFDRKTSARTQQTQPCCSSAVRRRRSNRKTSESGAAAVGRCAMRPSPTAHGPRPLDPRTDPERGARTADGPSDGAIYVRVCRSPTCFVGYLGRRRLHANRACRRGCGRSHLSQVRKRSKRLPKDFARRPDARSDVFSKTIASRIIRRAGTSVSPRVPSPQHLA